MRDGMGAGRVLVPTVPRPRTCAMVLFTMVAAVVLGAAAATAGHLGIGAAGIACLLPLTPLLLMRPRWAAACAIAFLPLEADVLSSRVAGVNVAPSDLLIAAAAAGVGLQMTQNSMTRRRAMQALRPVGLPLGVYFAVAAVVFSAHPSAIGAVALLQRVELVVVTFVVGACLLHGEFGRRVMLVFVATCLLLAALWTFGRGSLVLLAGQKNPAGQFICDATLISLVLVRSWLRYPLAAVFVLAVYATESRGALAGLLAGLVVLVLLRNRNALQAVIGIAAVGVTLYVGFYLLPGEAQQRVLGQTQATRNSDHIRHIYSRDARHIISTHPLLGVGIGNYHAGTQIDLTETDDPHAVLLLQAAEGGYPLLAAFLVMQLGALAAVLRRRRDSPVAALAIALQLATLTHAVIDIYWVRGTPVAGWVLIGMALSGAADGALPAPRRRVLAAS